jgi:hypothetical protein
MMGASGGITGEGRCAHPATPATAHARSSRVARLSPSRFVEAALVGKGDTANHAHGCLPAIRRGHRAARGIDGDNRLLAEAHRAAWFRSPDTLLFVAGQLDQTRRRPSGSRNYATQKVRRMRISTASLPEWISWSAAAALYCYVAAQTGDQTMALLFSDPSSTADRRFTTSRCNSACFPEQRFHCAQADRRDRYASLAKRGFAGTSLVWACPLPKELSLGCEFLIEKANLWPEYAQARLASNEFLYVK